jgi:glycosyltransferase involved in cell wall biosynthesis
MAEALATGTPVVATPAGAAPEIVDDGVTGYLRSEIDAMATCLTQAGSLDRERCRHAALSRFSAQRMVTEHLNLYRELLAAAHSAPQHDRRHGHLDPAR